MKCDVWVSCSVHADGTFHGKPVGLDLNITARGAQGKIIYRSVGERSDRLLAALTNLYKLPKPPAGFAGEALADIVFLDANDHKMSGKVFFAANGPETSYAELYTNIDKVRGVVEIREKDPEYRKNIIRALSR